MTRITSLETFVFRCPIDVPVRTSFGVMTDRPMVLARLTDQDGIEGWGEIWCNFPTITPEYRARIVTEILGLHLIGREFESPAALSELLRRKTALLAIQSNEHGPFQSAIAGVDIAAHDLFSCRAALPLCAYLGGSADHVAVYASGIGPENPAETVEAKRQQGYQVFKLKVGFERQSDHANIEAVLDQLGAGERLALDANQGWEVDEAKAFLGTLGGMGIAWVEEPLRADSPADAWLALRADTVPPIAAGENMSSQAQFAAGIEAGILDIIQPDIAKWGGISLGKQVAQDILGAGLSYYPHFLGGGVGLAASAHLLAVVGGDGLLEVDSNPNQLREIILETELIDPSRGYRFSDKPGLGVTPNITELQPFLKGHWQCTT
jgi:L-alanine-DL-glutamate epimerase-like enolase superfamily enzyme